MFTLNQLRLFLAVAHTGSLTRAAKLLDQTQPSLSQHIAKLEDSVGQLLFERGRGQFDLTEAGRFLCRHAEIIMAEVDAAAAGLDISFVDLEIWHLVGHPTDAHARAPYCGGRWSLWRCQRPGTVCGGPSSLPDLRLRNKLVTLATRAGRILRGIVDAIHSARTSVSSPASRSST